MILSMYPIGVRAPRSIQRKIVSAVYPMRASRKAFW